MGLVRTNWQRGLLGIVDVGCGKVTQQVGAIIGSNGDSMAVSAGANMLQVATHWAGFECSIKMLLFQENPTQGIGSIQMWNLTYSISTSAYVGIYPRYWSDGSCVTVDGDYGAEPVVFNWQAVIVSI